MSILRLQGLHHCIAFTWRISIHQQRLAIPRSTGYHVFQRTGDTLCSTGRGWGGQTRFISEALLREEHEAVEAVAKKTVRRRKKVEPHEEAVTTTATTPKVTKPRTKKAASSQQVKDDISGDGAGSVVKSRKKKAVKDKETSETTIVADEAAAAQTAVVATKIKRATKSKSKSTTTLDTSSATQTVIPEPPQPPVKTQLRPYQQECIDKCLENLKNGIMRQIVSLPVGSGKTVRWWREINNASVFSIYFFCQELGVRSWSGENCLFCSHLFF